MFPRSSQLLVYELECHTTNISGGQIKIFASSIEFSHYFLVIIGAFNLLCRYFLNLMGAFHIWVNFLFMTFGDCDFMHAKVLTCLLRMWENMAFSSFYQGLDFDALFSCAFIVFQWQCLLGSYKFCMLHASMHMLILIKLIFLCPFFILYGWVLLLLLLLLPLLLFC